MKLASLKSGRDGALHVVKNDLSAMADAQDIAPTLQAALDDWSNIKPRLQDRYEALEAGLLTSQAFDQTLAASPLPRAYQWADGSAYVNHVELVRKARNAEMPASFWTTPLMYQGGSDSFLAPYDPIKMVQSEGFGIDFEAEIAVITSDVPMGVKVDEAASYIQLIMLVNDVSLRGLIPAELSCGFGFFQSKPSSAFSPVCVTPESLGDAWHEGKLSLPLHSSYNQELFGKPNAGVDMTFDFAQLIAHAAKTRPLVAGTVIGSGTVSNKLDGEPGKAISEGGVGYSCIAELRMIETINNGSPTTPFMDFGDSIAIEMFDDNNQSIFGSIQQIVVKA
jgi:fumarylacetoacetate (FAA) hydrolase